MNSEQKTWYADFLMGMRLRGKYHYDGNKYISENKAAAQFYGEKYHIIRDDFSNRVAKDLSNNIAND